MDYEKAKAYDKAIKVIKDNLDALNEIVETGAKVVNIQIIKNCFYRAFPELKESENEEIRKEFTAFLKKASEGDLDMKIPYKTFGKWLAWLEKQDKQKPFWSERIIADVFEKVGLAKIIREQGNDELTSAVQRAMIEIEKQCGPNPYSGVTFDYNGHTWGMCARDGGVEILRDGQLIGCSPTADLSNCSEEYRKAYYDGWNNCNMQHSQYKSDSNKDEKIRNEIIEMLNNLASQHFPLIPPIKQYNKWIAWLETHKYTKEIEKQGKQNRIMLWHNVNDEPEEQYEILCEWEGAQDVWHDVAVYHADDKTFWNGSDKIENVVRWCYVDDIAKK